MILAARIDVEDSGVFQTAIGNLIMTDAKAISFYSNVTMPISTLM